MKSLKDQIEFIDKKLLVLYGFKDIRDYSHTICIGEPDTIPIDLNKLNEIINEFRKIFHAKNFSLHKTQYKILTKSQAVCLLKTSLEITSIPFDISFKQKKKYLRLISKNNILEDYINTLKMAENSTFESKLEQSKQTEQNEHTEQIKNLESMSTYKINEKPKMITKEQLNENIKKIFKFEFYINPKKHIIYNFHENIMSINMKSFELNDKILKSFCVRFISKKKDGVQIITNDVIEYLIKDILFGVKIWEFDDYYNWTGKFKNGENCIIDNVILPMKYIWYHNVMLCLFNIKNIENLLDNLEIVITGEYINLYSELDNVIESSCIEQSIKIDDKCNLLRIRAGFCSNAYKEYIYPEMLEGKTPILNKSDIINESKSFVGKSMNIGNIEGFEITNHSKELTNNIIKKIFQYQYEFACWDEYCEKNANNVEYYKTIEKNSYNHFYKIKLSLNNTNRTYDTASKIQIITNLTNETNIEIFLSNGKIIQPIKFTNINGVIELDFENKQMILENKISHVLIKIISDSYDEPINNMIHVSMKVFQWNSKYEQILMNSKNLMVDVTIMNS